MKAREKLAALVATWYEGQNVPGMKTPTPSALFELWNICAKTQKTTICSDVVEVLTRCKIETKRRGIGWEVIG